MLRCGRFGSQDCAMRDSLGWSDIVFRVSVAIIVMELVLLLIGLNLAAGFDPAVIASLSAQ
jgi:hypothetical protein